MEAFVMIPRLKSSKKWTSFPKEYSDQIQAVFKENFAQYLDNAQLIIEGRIYQEEIVLRVGYLEEGRLAQANFEVSMSYSQEQQDAVSRIHNCVDAAASMMMEFLENEGEVDFPYTWKEVPFQGKKVYLKFSTENSDLEAEANKILGLSEEEMLHDTNEEEDEDALSRAEQSEELSPPRDDEDYSKEGESADEGEEDSEDKGPKMFGGKGKKQLH
ncbi:hypothetical protein Bdt_2050 [Bdellovibrio bacteriovorus str. Tiberius]|uniref:Uncharacterized protein n=2 Tax=Bdellovibrio bacteriovorus TaxID=959 RepID=K7YPF6_BDEBC|nr:hypothetical protein Bdt_2050 [Bdellovibrio bacteriovorus str. Tiberius]